MGRSVMLSARLLMLTWSAHMRTTSLLLSCVLSLPAVLSVTASPAQADRCPKVHIVLDRSGSMGAALPGSSATRWTAAKEAVNTVLTKFKDQFPVGLSLFPQSECDSQLVSEPAYNIGKKLMEAM